MLIKNPNHTISFSLFSEFPGLVCVMSTKKWGDLNLKRHPISQASLFLNAVNIEPNKVIKMEQVHGARVEAIDKCMSLVEHVDGLISTKPNLFLAVRTADCVPLFFYDLVLKHVGIAHAGWRGTLYKIAQNVIKQFKILGSEPKNILVAIGPHIGACCYNVQVERAGKFLKIFSSERIVFKNNGQWNLDLGQANRQTLLDVGILEKHIDNPIICTSCQSDTFFSYRKEGPNTYGEMLGVIGIRN